MSVLTFFTPRAIYCLIMASCFYCKPCSFYFCASSIIFENVWYFRFYEIDSSSGYHFEAFLASSRRTDSCEAKMLPNSASIAIISSNGLKNLVFSPSLLSFYIFMFDARGPKRVPVVLTLSVMRFLDSSRLSFSRLKNFSFSRILSSRVILSRIGLSLIALKTKSSMSGLFFTPSPIFSFFFLPGDLERPVPLPL